MANWSAERRKVPPHPTLDPIGAMQELIDRALDAAERSGASYADIRLVERESESLTVKNGALESAEAQRTAGLGVRLLLDGAWGFASSGLLEPDEAERVAREAAVVARASASARRDMVRLDDTTPARGRYATPITEDPFNVSLDEKLRILLEADREMAAVPGVTIREGSMDWGRERKTFASSEGAHTEQEFVEAGGGIEATAVNDNEVQLRTYPQGSGGQLVTGGFEAGSAGPFGAWPAGVLFARFAPRAAARVVFERFERTVVGVRRDVRHQGEPCCCHRNDKRHQKHLEFAP